VCFFSVCSGLICVVVCWLGGGVWCCWGFVWYGGVVLVGLGVSGRVALVLSAGVVGFGALFVDGGGFPWCVFGFVDGVLVVVVRFPVGSVGSVFGVRLGLLRRVVGLLVGVWGCDGVCFAGLGEFGVGGGLDCLVVCDVVGGVGGVVSVGCGLGFGVVGGVLVWDDAVSGFVRRVGGSLGGVGFVLARGLRSGGVAGDVGVVVEGLLGDGFGVFEV
jgi:hypothetical protein